ncbi:Mitochondrial inner membrane protease subunit 1 [Rhodotorula toruloides]|uniref:Mitochondrial inner membrane protease subunit n=1 Tax=Rhodotorula toruloides TaxID=5286 RepID=A0A0K3C8Z7_RHOTO|nr:Mitochondrial inner membrane protease subunit 1 [Rhodotorula toruloides]PRQ76912.1 Peptidase S24/S26A/S26B/S26C [Rhodotorula toruloides]
MSAARSRFSLLSPERLQRLRRAGKFTVVTVQVLVAVHLFNQNVAEIRPCAGASMYPTLKDEGTLVLHSPLALRLFPIERGNLVTAVSPNDPAHQILKRVIGLPGDTVCVDPSGERKKTDAEWRKTPVGRVKGDVDPAGEWRRTDVEWCTVPPGHVWIAGDNTSNSTDSRDYGPVPIGLLKGKIICRIWPNPGPLNTTFHKVNRA